MSEKNKETINSQPTKLNSSPYYGFTVVCNQVIRFDASTTCYWDEDPRCPADFLTLTKMEITPAFDCINA